MPPETTRSALLKRSIYLLVLPVGGVAALLVGITGSLDGSRATANWLVVTVVGVVLLAATGVVALRPRALRLTERVLVAAAVAAFLVALAAVVASSLRSPGGHVDDVVRIALWTAAIAGFAHLALPAPWPGRVSWGLWTMLVVASGVVLALEASATVGDRTTLIEAVLVQGCALVLIGGIVRVTGSERERATAMASLATSDALTGLLNRRGAEERLQAEVDRSRRYGHPLSVAWFDLDHFKQVNDRYGHEVGDVVLSAIATVVRRSVRAPDSVARWGGEEFAVVLPEQGLDEASRTAERLRQAIEGLELDLPGEERVTASFGVAELGPTESVADLVRRADQSVYAAKHGGRNQVVAGVPSGATAS